MAELLQPPAGLFDDAGSIVQDLPCRRCGYNLRGLAHAGRCPECGTPVGRSTYGDLLQFSDPEWLDKLAKGANLILWGVLIGIVADFAGGILTVAAGLPPALQSLITVGAYMIG